MRALMNDRISYRCTALALPLLLTTQLHAAQPLNAELNEQVEMIAVDQNLLGMKTRLQTTLFKPQGQGPFPLFVLIPGKPKANPAQLPRMRFVYLAQELVNRGYLVAVVMPRGYANSGGSFNQPNCSVLGTAQQQGKDVNALVAELAQRPDVDGDKVIVAGHSVGGVSALAAGAGPAGQTRLLFNFAGGVRFDDCDWQQALVDAMGELGKSSQTKSLWVYSDGDLIFGPEVVTAMQAAFQGTGGRSQLFKLNLNQIAAHSGFSTHQGFAQWWPQVAPVLADKGFPVEKTDTASSLSYAASSYATPLQYDRLPAHAVDACKAKYKEVVGTLFPLSFAFSKEGGCGWGADADEAMSICLANSNSRSCQMYLVDQQVVWQGIE